jgi:hypothetical protein
LRHDPARIIRSSADHKHRKGVAPESELHQTIIPTVKVVAMKTLKFWFRPAIFVLFWVVLTAFTLAELATVTPLLRGERPRVRQARHAVQLSSARR